jgi:hypothetical protein
MKIADLRPLLDKTVSLQMTDGEIAKVRVDYVSDEYDDIMVDVLETTRPQRYKVPQAAYTFAAADIVRVVQSDSER